MLYSVYDISHGLSRCFGHILVGNVFLNVDFFQLICVDRIGQHRLQVPQIVFTQEAILGII